MAKVQTRRPGSIEQAFAALELELSETRQRQLQSVVTRTATGNGNIDQLAKLDQRFRLVFIRCHFAGAAGTASFTVSLDSSAGAAFDARLFTIMQAGTNKDVHLRIGGGDTGDPAAWTFQAGDAIRIQWTNPNSGNITWGLEVGLAMAA